ncbi:B12-binding domain-containing radical SAM protein [Methanoculleus frigidifontis]|nr:radical SAM protein [Methanoculleus sp. FWC-SCC1]
MNNDDKNIALINCPLSLGNAFFNENQSVHPPIGSASIAGSLLKEGFQVKCYDFDVLINKDITEICPEAQCNDLKIAIKHRNLFSSVVTQQALLKDKIFPEIYLFDRLATHYASILIDSFDVVSFSLMYFNETLSLFTAKKLKEMQPNIDIILGGPQTMLMRDVYFKFNFIDAVFIGEGEKSIVNWMNNRLSYDKQIPSKKTHTPESTGFYYRNGNQDVYFSRVEQIKTLDELPSPYFDDYIEHTNTYLLKKTLPIEFSRGCIGKCAFCSDRYYFKGFRTKSAEKIFDEILMNISKYGINRFEVSGLLINGDPSILEDLCDLIIEDDVIVHISGRAKIDKLPRNLIKKLGLAGFEKLSIGIESGSRKILEKMKKIHPANITEVLGQLSSNHIDIHAYFMVGFPGETADDIAETVKFINENSNFITAASISPFTLVSPSYISLHPEEFGLEITEFTIALIDEFKDYNEKMRDLHNLTSRIDNCAFQEAFEMLIREFNKNSIDLDVLTKHQVGIRYFFNNSDIFHYYIQNIHEFISSNDEPFSQRNNSFNQLIQGSRIICPFCNSAVSLNKTCKCGVNVTRELLHQHFTKKMKELGFDSNACPIK